MRLHASRSTGISDVDRCCCRSPCTSFSSLASLPLGGDPALTFLPSAHLAQCVVGIYRIQVIRNNTTSLYSTSTGSQNQNPSKVGFYVFHVALEFLSAAILISLNARRVFATGMWGDKLKRDPVPETKNEA